VISCSHPMFSEAKQTRKASIQYGKESHHGRVLDVGLSKIENAEGSSS
jgi:hypothetical protein